MSIGRAKERIYYEPTYTIFKDKEKVPSKHYYFT